MPPWPPEPHDCPVGAPVSPSTGGNRRLGPAGEHQSARRAELLSARDDGAAAGHGGATTDEPAALAGEPLNGDRVVPVVGGLLPDPRATTAQSGRVDALRSHRSVRVSLEGITLAESATPVLVFETGLPTRYYFDRTDANFGHLVPTGTQTACRYKGVTSAYWSVCIGDDVRDGHQDLAWAYDFSIRQLQPTASLVAFYNEKTDIDVDGVRLPSARTHFFG